MKSKIFPVFAAISVIFMLGCQSTSVWTLLEKDRIPEAKDKFLGEAGVDERDGKGRTALHIAAEKGDGDLARFLLALGAAVDLEDNLGRTPLAISAGKDDPLVGAILAAAHADIHHVLAADGSETIALKAIWGPPSFLGAILSGDAGSTDSSGKTILHLAAIEGAYFAVDTILAKGTQINKKDSEYKTALDYAFIRTDSVSHVQTAEKLILAEGLSENPFFAAFAPPALSSNYNLRLYDGYTALHYAAREDYLGYIDFLIQKKADINAKNNSGSTPLHEASREGRIRAMNMLIASGADVNAQDAKGNTSLHLAIPPEQHRNAVMLLLSNGANLNLRDEHGEIPLQIAVTLNRPPEIAGSLLAGGSDVSNRNIDGKTALYMAVEEERLELIPLLLRYHSDIFASDNAGRTPLERALGNYHNAIPLLINEETVLESDNGGNNPLHIAVKNRAAPSIIGMILEKGALVDTRNKEGNTALHLAVETDDEPSGSLLLEGGADIFPVNAAGESPLYLAFTSPGKVRQWMLTQKTLAAQDGLGNTALHYAARWKQARHIPLLVQQGSRLEAANASGETPLFMAARADSPETIQALLQAGALIQARDTLGNSALHCAVRWNAPKSADALIGAGIGVNVQNLAGKAPLHEAVRLGLPLDVLLIRRGANLEIRDAQGNTPLMEAVIAGFSGSAERLTSSGADPVTRNNNGDTPLHFAVDISRMDLITLLLGCGVPIHSRNSRGVTPFTAALSDSPQMVSLLLTRDRIFAADDDGLSPLHIAVKCRASSAALQTIIRQGARISEVDAEGRTPLRLALEMNSLNEAKLLADAGSDVFIPAADGKTPADAALTKGDRAVRALFSGEAINARDGRGNTVLHYAAQTGKTDMIGILLELGANKNIRNIAAESPEDIALRWNHRDAAFMLNPAGI